jgi:sulfur carrier protein ThiS
MRITVNIYANLRYYLPEFENAVKDKEWHLPEGSTVGQVLKRLGLPREIRVMILVNNNSVHEKTVLEEGDIIHILPQMVGG